MINRFLKLGSALLLTTTSAMAGDRLFGFAGTTDFGQFGTSTSAAGDVNADGFDDFVVGATNLAMARVYSGRTGLALWEFHGGGAFGWSVAGAGDVNQDGFADVIVGGDGSARVYSGQTGQVIYVKTDVTSALGTSVDGIGDANGDGYDDFVVGAPFASTSGLSINGYAKLYSGKNGVELQAWYGTKNDSQLGMAASKAGDVDHDGHADVLIGAPHYPGLFGITLGAAFLYSGATGALLHAVYGGNGDDEFAVRLSGGSDLDGDGYADFVVGAPWSDANGVNSGLVNAYSGKDATLLHSWYGVSAFDYLGLSVGCTGDVDGDGHGDVIVGAPRETGTVGSTPYAGAARVFSGMDGSLMREILGLATGEALGNAVSGAGDVNGDGYADYLVADNENNEFAPLGGAAWLYSGRDYDASWANYGTGWAGTLGVPSFTASGDPTLCNSITLAIGNSRGATTAAVLFLGLTPGSIITGWDGSILIGLPWWIFPATVPAAGLSLPINVLCDASLLGLGIFAQALELDPGATQGVSFSRGLQLVLGL